jgi:intraflagellar transport protein 122
MKAGSVMAEILASQGRYDEAAKCFKENKEEHRAAAMYADLRQFDLAQEFLGGGNTVEKVEMMKRKADWAVKINEFRAAADMYLVAGEKLKAIALMEENGWTDM